MSNIRLLVLLILWLATSVATDRVPTSSWVVSEPGAYEGTGAPWVHFAEGYWLGGTLEGPLDLRVAVASGRAAAKSVVESDLDGDDRNDLVIGYAYQGRGIIGVRYGNRSRGDILADAHNVNARPWSATMQLFEADAEPDFMSAGDFDGDNHIDLLAASRTASEMTLLAGGAAEVRFQFQHKISLPGRVTALRTGEINRQDGYPDIVVGVANSQSEGSIVLFEGWDGALTEDPVSIELDGPPLDIAIGQLDGHYAFDLAVASRSGVTVYRGEDRSVVNNERANWRPKAGYSYRSQDGVSAVAIGNLIGDSRNELAMIDGRGRLIVAEPIEDRTTLSDYRFEVRDKVPPPALRFANISSLPGADLLVLDRNRKQVHLLHAEHYRSFLPVRMPARLEETELPSPLPPPVTFGLPGVPVDLGMQRVNGDGADDLVLVLESALDDGMLTADGGFGSKGDLTRMLSRPSAWIMPSKPASVFTVNADGDGWDANFGDGLCATTSGECTFQAAVQESKEHPGRDLIDFSIRTITATAGFFSIITEAVDILGNSQGRVLFEQPQNIPYGGSKDNVPVKGSVISGLAINGCIQASSANGGFEFRDNYVGTDRTGNGPAILGNFVCRNLIMDAPDGLVTENVVAGDLRIEEPEAIVVANRVGVRADGTGTVGRIDTLNQRGGRLTITTNGFNASVVNQNIIASESTSSLLISRVDGTLLDGNFVGFSPLAPGVRMGEGRGIEVTNTLGTTIRRGYYGRNAVLANAQTGISLSGADSTIIQGNIVGNNLGHGIFVSNSFAVLVGGLGADHGNAIIRNGLDGVFVRSIFPVTVQGNFVGVDFDGENDFGNGENGITVESNAHLVGAPRTERFGRNVIAFNGKNGIHIDGDSVQVVGNFIGTSETGVLQGNLEHGIYIDSNSKDNLIGGDNPDHRNVIAGNGMDGVFLWRGGGGLIERNRILGNEIRDNVELGINLDNNFDETPDGVSENDPGDDDTGTNGYQNFPELSVNADGSLAVRLDSRPNQSYRIEYFGNPECDPSGHGEGHSFVGSDTLTTDAGGIAQVTASLQIFEGQEFVTATATDLDGNTSEFSACAELAPEPALRIRVMFVDDSDNLVPAVRQSFQVGRWEPNGANDPFQWVATETSDDDGVIALRADGLEPGDPVVVRSFVHTEPAVKINHQDVEDIAHEIFVDNLLVESTGRLATDEIDTNPAATTEVVLSHSTIVFNLLVSIQWKALDSYVAGLRAALRNASDYLYDVTNGQAQLGKISIYDNARLWNSADIQIHANNTLRDNADLYGWKAADQYVRLSPKSYGGGAQDRNDIFRDDPLDPNSVDNYRTIIHELGHYLLGFLDEYENAAGEAKHAGTNFGFMDYYYATGFGGSQALRSEMSMYVDASYRDVEQFEVYGKTSWQQFHDTYSNSYSGIVIPILTPEDYGAPFSEPYIPGPNEVNGSLDYPTGALMDISVSSQASDAAGKVLIIRDAQGRGLRNMDVTLGVVGSRRAPDCFIYQGQTTDRGEIRLLGADIRDVVTITGDIDGAYFGDALVIATTQESIVTIGPAAPGGLVSEVSSSANGDLVLTSSADWDLVEAPEVQPEAFCGTVPPVLRKIAVSTKRPGAFSWSFGAPPTGESTLRLGLTDAAGDSMVVHTPLSVHNFSPDSLATVSSASGFALELDSVATGVERIAVASARFPPPRQGLRDSLRLVSRVHSVDVFPLPSELDGYLSISYDTQESVGSVEDGIQIYRYANESWQPVETTLEFLNRKATVQFVETGTYAAFADLTVTGTAKEPSVGEEPALELRLYPNYPNPFTRVTEVSYELPAPGHARLAVYDLLGRRVRVLSDGDRDKGRHELTFDGAGLSSGIYILELRVGQRKLTQTMMLAR